MTNKKDDDMEGYGKVFTVNSQPFEAKNRDTNEEDFVVEGYITTDSVDKVRDVVTRGCMRDMISQLRQHNIKLDYEHEVLDEKEGEPRGVSKTRMPAGKIEKAELRDKGIFVRAVINPDYAKTTSTGQVIQDYESLTRSIRNGYLDGFSIAYKPEKTRVVTRNGERVRLLERVDLINVALTGVPVNSESQIESFERVAAKSLKFIEQHRHRQEPKYGDDNMTEQPTESKADDDMIDNIMMKVKAGDELTSEEESVLEAALEAAKSTQSDNEEKEMSEDEEEEKQMAKPQNASSDSDIDVDDSEISAKSLEQLKSDYKELKAEMKSMKDKLSEPMYKGTKTQDSPATNQESKSHDASPLDIISGNHA